MNAGGVTQFSVSWLQDALEKRHVEYRRRSLGPAPAKRERWHKMATCL
ncbi:hypothetical protein RBWH47_02880 [Rhodopirellula baltica WH47]|uniref:Uncharacterized protein n=1 Tax=Rhodopirellula baltica WH47 TaxID=991778 RepID=F2AM50_RHOBT|nr:hypothetical protein RBWH47_02880 [Rhodopirellula baltica WH47]